MKKIELIKMEFQNFKSVRKNMVIDVDGKNLNLLGKNGTGKTTIFDVFTFVLFGKDSLGRDVSNKAFEIKPKNNETGEIIPNLETTAVLTLSIDGDDVELKRVYKEKHTKKRGSEEKIFDGNTTDFYINGVEKKKTEFDSFITTQIMDEELFKLLTDIRYFNSDKLKDDARRKMLEKLITLTDENIIDATAELQPLKEHLIFGRTVEDVIKIQLQEQSAINAQLKSGIPAELKALHELEYPNLKGIYDVDENTKKLEQSYKKLSDIDTKLASGNNKSELQELDETKSSLKNDITKLERDYDNLSFEVKSNHQNKILNEKGILKEIEYKIDKYNNDLSNISERIKNGLESIQTKEEEKNELYKKFDEIRNEVFNGESCTHCGQVLPKDKLDEALEHFNLHKAERLEKIRDNGTKYNADIEKYTEAVDELKGQAKELSNLLTIETEKLNKQRKVVEDLESIKTFAKTEKQIDIEKDIDTVQGRLKIIEKQIEKTKKQGSNDLLENARKEIQNEINFLNTQNAEYQLKIQNQEKIKKLELQQKDLSSKYEEAEFIKNLGEKFRVIKAKKLEENINDNFEIVKFKLFFEQQNGGIQNVCDANYKGTDYQSCSNGEKINIGLDIIKGLQKIYGVSAPIFIDNAEGVSDWLVDIDDQQLVKMYVAPEVEELIIKIENEIEERK